MSKFGRVFKTVPGPCGFARKLQVFAPVSVERAHFLTSEISRFVFRHREKWVSRAIGEDILTVAAADNWTVKQLDG